MLTKASIDEIGRRFRGGQGIKRIAREMQISRNTVRRYVRIEEAEPLRREGRPPELDGLDHLLRDAFERHDGNASAVWRELDLLHGIRVSVRTVQRALARFRPVPSIVRKSGVRKLCHRGAGDDEGETRARAPQPGRGEGADSERAPRPVCGERHGDGSGRQSATIGDRLSGPATPFALSLLSWVRG